MARMPRAYESKSYEEWRDESWEGAESAVVTAIDLLKEHGMRRIKIGKPFDIEVEAFPVVE